MGGYSVKEINVAVVGCGYVAKDHIKAWRRIKEAQIVAISDLNEKLAEDTAKLWKIPSYYRSLPDLIKHNKPDVVDICTPPQTHATLAIQAMKVGSNVLMEKPMTMNIKDAEEIVNCQKITGVKAGVIHNWLFEPPVLKANSFVKKYLGEILSMNIETLNTKYDSMAANKDHWCHSLPGGRFSEMLAHPIYLIRHFLGEVEVDYIQISKIGDYSWMKSDEFCATFRVKKKLARAYASFNAPREAIFITLYGKESILKLDIINAVINVLPRRKTSRFSKGFDSLRQAIQFTTLTAENAVKIIFNRWFSGHDLYIKLFADSLINNSKSPVTVQDGLEVIKTLEELCTRIEEKEILRMK